MHLSVTYQSTPLAFHHLHLSEIRQSSLASTHSSSVQKNYSIQAYPKVAFWCVLLTMNIAIYHSNMGDKLGRMSHVKSHMSHAFLETFCCQPIKQLNVSLLQECSMMSAPNSVNYEVD